MYKSYGPTRIKKIKMQKTQMSFLFEIRYQKFVFCVITDQSLICERPLIQYSYLYAMTYPFEFFQLTHKPLPFHLLVLEYV